MANIRVLFGIALLAYICVANPFLKVLSNLNDRYTSDASHMDINNMGMINDKHILLRILISVHEIDLISSFCIIPHSINDM